MAKKGRGNGLAATNEILQAILGELGAIKGRLGELDAIKSELTEIKTEVVQHGKILREHGQILREHGQILREHGEILRDHSVRLTNIEGSMRQVAAFVGQDRLEQNQRMQGLTQRVEILERKVA